MEEVSAFREEQNPQVDSKDIDENLLQLLIYLVEIDIEQNNGGDNGQH